LIQNDLNNDEKQHIIEIVKKKEKLSIMKQTE